MDPSKRGQREGKALMVDEDIHATHKTKEQKRQEEAGLKEAIKLQAQLDEKVAKQIHLDKMTMFDPPLIEDAVRAYHFNKRWLVGEAIRLMTLGFEGIKISKQETSCPVGVVLLVKDCRMINLIMEYLVKDSKRRAFWSLNEDILKITILKTNTPYPSRKIRRIRAYIHQRPQRSKDQYVVSKRSQYAVLKI
ncbi:hypothetical protein Tco_0862118 [Tanacetum coccineum]